jgi:hypothetical protein
MYKFPTSSYRVTLWDKQGRCIEGYLVKVGQTRARGEESAVAKVVLSCWAHGKGRANAVGVDLSIPTGKTELGFTGADDSSLRLQSLALAIKDTANKVKPIWQDVCFVAHGVSEYFLLDSLYSVPTDHDVSHMGGFRLQTVSRFRTELRVISTQDFVNVQSAFLDLTTINYENKLKSLYDAIMIAANKKYSQIRIDHNDGHFQWTPSYFRDVWSGLVGKVL